MFFFSSLTDALLRKAFATPSFQGYNFVSSLLVLLGLIKVPLIPSNVFSIKSWIRPPFFCNVFSFLYISLLSMYHFDVITAIFFDLCAPFFSVLILTIHPFVISSLLLRVKTKWSLCSWFLDTSTPWSTLFDRNISPKRTWLCCRPSCPGKGVTEWASQEACYRYKTQWLSHHLQQWSTHFCTQCTQWTRGDWLFLGWVWDGFVLGGFPE